MDIAQTIIFWIAVITLHELGHIISWMILEKNKPSITFKWWGAIIIGEKQSHLLTIKNNWYMLGMGIATGSIPFYITQTPISWFLLYLLISLMDIAGMIQLMQVPRWQWNWKCISVTKYQIKKLEEKTK